MSQLNFERRLTTLMGIEITYDEIKTLLTKKINSTITGDQIPDILGLTGPRRITVQRAFESIDSQSIKNLLESWLVLLKYKSHQAISPTLCLTGINPEGYQIQVCDTYQTFLDLVKKAKKRIIIIGYHFTDGNEELIKRLDERLKKDRIEIKVLTDHLISSIADGNHRFLRRWLKDTNLRFKLFSYEHPDIKELMHVKCMLVDDEAIYIGSANFSYSGVKKNIELGIVLWDKDVNKTIDSVFMNFINDSANYIEEIKYSKLRKEGII